MGTKSEVTQQGVTELASATSASPLEAAIREMAAVMRRHRLTYEQGIYVTRQARKRLNVKPHKRSTRLLPRNLTDRELTDFFAAVEKGGNARHILLFHEEAATKSPNVREIRPKAA